MKLCTGGVTTKAGNVRNSKAFAEGLHFRAQGTAAAYPLTGNPHDGTGSEAEDCWDAGWGVAHAAAGGTIDPADAPCVAVPHTTISA